MAVPMPSNCFLHTLERAKHSGGKRWRSDCGDYLYEWDLFHGEIEMYDKLGRHVGVLDKDGVYKKPAVKGRKIDV